jgi:hypothetical protein
MTFIGSALQMLADLPATEPERLALASVGQASAAGAGRSLYFPVNSAQSGPPHERRRGVATRDARAGRGLYFPVNSRLCGGRSERGHGAADGARTACRLYFPVNFAPRAFVRDRRTVGAAAALHKSIVDNNANTMKIPARLRPPATHRVVNYLNLLDKDHKRAACSAA